MIPDRPVKTAIEQLTTELNLRTGGSSERLQSFIEKYEEKSIRQFIDKRLGFEITETEVLRMMKAL